MKPHLTYSQIKNILYKFMLISFKFNYISHKIHKIIFLGLLI